MTEPKVHTFNSTSDAYDATQCDEDIKDGDVLVIEPEKVVGIAYTRPFALTEHIGELHAMTNNPRTYKGGIFAAGVDRAEQIAREHGWLLAPHLDLGMARAFLTSTPPCGEPLGYRVLTAKTDTGRLRTGWLIAGTTGFIELDIHGHYRFASEWLPFNKQED
ncbi:hypothetical protein [Streptomyces werraensis]|uniref:hypothetical protein n=1 Tax=Streptomyces werraensis TaxID=68284 RepID=UPI003448FC5D